MRLLVILAALVLLTASVDCAPSPFFDAIYDALNGNGRRSYGYSGYGNYEYRPSYDRYNVQRERPSRHEKSYKELCRVHFPDSVAVPGAGGIVCPY